VGLHYKTHVMGEEKTKKREGLTESCFISAEKYPHQLKVIFI